MGSFQSPITIHQAIERIKRNEILLPAFQREYQWKAEQVQNLFDSIMCGYPVGSFLFWKVKGQAKSAYLFYRVLEEYVERHKTHNSRFDTSATNDFHAVLDGQQRLTSLYIGLCGSYAYHKSYQSWNYSPNSFPRRTLYLKLADNGRETDENVNRFEFLFLEDAVTKNADLHHEDDSNWFRVGKILDLTTGDLDKQDITDFSQEHNLSATERKILELLREKIKSQAIINYYEEETTNPDEAVNIFVRINSGGSPLSMSQILMSMAVASWKKDARTEIFDLIDRVNALGFDIDTDYVFKAILMLFHPQLKSSIKYFTNDFNSKIEGKWDTVRDAIYELFELLRTFGLNARCLTSNNATLPVLYYLYHNNLYKDFSRLARHDQDRQAIRTWLMKSLVLKTFGGSSDRILSKSRQALADSERGQEPTPKCLSQFPAKEISALLNQSQSPSDEYLDDLLSEQKDSRLAFAVLSMLYPHLDFVNVAYHRDHLHPASSWKSGIGHEWRKHNSIVNLQMLSDADNKSKQDQSLSEWVEEQTTKKGYPRVQFLNDHLIPATACLDLSDFADFYEKRKVLLRDRLRYVISK